MRSALPRSPRRLAVMVGTCLTVAIGALVSPSSVVAADTVPILWEAGGQNAGIGSDGQGTRIASDAAGNVTVLGSGSQVGPATVVSYTATGTERWRSTIVPTSGHYVGRSVDVAPDGDVVVTVTNIPNSSSNIPLGSAIVRYSSTGVEEWRVVHDGRFLDYARATLDAAGNTYVVFSYNGTSVRKYSPTGALLWEDAGGVGAAASSIALSPDGTEVFATSTTAANWIVIGRNATTGAKTWTVNQPIGRGASDLVVDADRVYVGGTGNVGISTYLTLAAFDRATGALEWRTDTRPAGSNAAAGYWIDRAPDGSLVVAGWALRGFPVWYTVAFETTGEMRWDAVRAGGLNTDELPAAIQALDDGTTVVTGVGGPRLTNGFIQGVTVGYSASGELVWEGFSDFATEWSTVLPNGNVCTTGGYDAYVSCFEPVGQAPKRIHLSSSTDGAVGAVAFADEDVVVADEATGAWSMVFDGSDVGLAAVDVDAFEMLADGRMLLSVDAPVTVAGVRYDDSDVIAFTPSSSGPDTAGTFAMYASGASLQLTTNAEDVDAIALSPIGDLLLSTTGGLKARGVSAPDEDLVRFAGAVASLYLDGSSIGLGTASKDLWGVSVQSDGRIDLSAEGGFVLPGGVNGSAGSVGSCTPAGIPAQVCFGTGRLAAGLLAPFAGEVIDAVAVVEG